MGLEKFGGFGDVEVKDVSDAESVVSDFESGGVVSLSVTRFAVDPGCGEEIHFQFDSSVAFAFGALSFFVVEGESGSGVATHTRFGEVGKEGADMVEELDIGRGAGAGGFTDGRLVDFVDVFDGVESSRRFEREGGVVGLAVGGRRHLEAASHKG